MERELKELIKTYEKWLRATQKYYEDVKREFENYPKTDLHSAFLSREEGKFENEIKVLKIVLHDLKEIINNK